MRVVPDGVADALDALLGVRQGLDIPAEDRRVYTLKGLALASPRAYSSGQCRSVRLLIDVLYPLRSTRSASASALAEDGFAASTVRQYLRCAQPPHHGRGRSIPTAAAALGPRAAWHSARASKRNAASGSLWLAADDSSASASAARLDWERLIIRHRLGFCRQQCLDFSGCLWVGSSRCRPFESFRRHGFLSCRTWSSTVSPTCHG